MAGTRQDRAAGAAGDQDGMAQRQQIHAGVHGQRGMQHGQRRGLDEAVEPQAGEEAHVVAAADVVDARVADLRQKGAGGLRAPLEQAVGREHADPRECGRADRFRSL